MLKHLFQLSQIHQFDLYYKQYLLVEIYIHFVTGRHNAIKMSLCVLILSYHFASVAQFSENCQCYLYHRCFIFSTKITLQSCPISETVKVKKYLSHKCFILVLQCICSRIIINLLQQKGACYYNMQQLLNHCWKVQMVVSVLHSSYHAYGILAYNPKTCIRVILLLIMHLQLRHVYYNWITVR